MSSTKDSVWNRLAHKYDKLWVQDVSLRATRTAVLNYLNKHIDGTSRILLDLGCGSGQMLAEVATRYPGLHLIGIDKSDEMLKAAGTKDTGAYLHCIDVSSDLLSETIPNDSIDIIVCCHSFPYYSEKSKVISMLHKSLKVDGVMIFVQASINNFYDRFIMTLVELTAEKADYLSKDEFSELVSDKFEIIDEFDIKEKAYMPTICGFVMRKR